MVCIAASEIVGGHSVPELPLANNDVSEKQERLIAKIKEKVGTRGTSLCSESSAGRKTAIGPSGIAWSTLVYWNSDVGEAAASAW
jgi:hypothetical protein